MHQQQQQPPPPPRELLPPPLHRRVCQLLPPRRYRGLQLLLLGPPRVGMQTGPACLTSDSL